MPFVEDFTPFLNTAEFATDGEWLSRGLGVRSSVVGIFDAGYGDAFDGLVGAQPPTYLVESAKFPGAAQGDELVINGVEYEITNIEPDGTGASLLRLRAV